MSSTLTGKKALVTGGAGGIGAAIARRLAGDGATVTVADVDGSGAEAVASELGGSAWPVDLSDTRAFEELELDVDVLVNNAGVQHVAPLEGFPPDRFRHLIALMLEAPFLLIRAALPAMYRRGYGRIINISSVHGVRASGFKAGYVAAKHGLEGLSKVTAIEGAAHGVTSNCVDPGYVRTALVDRQIADQARTHGISESEVIEKIMLARTAIKRLVEPDEVASLVAWLARPNAAMVTGASYTIDGGWTAQ